MGLDPACLGGAMLDGVYKSAYKFDCNDSPTVDREGASSDGCTPPGLVPCSDARVFWSC